MCSICSISVFGMGSDVGWTWPLSTLVPEWLHAAAGASAKHQGMGISVLCRNRSPGAPVTTVFFFVCVEKASYWSRTWCSWQRPASCPLEIRQSITDMKLNVFNWGRALQTSRKALECLWRCFTLHHVLGIGNCSFSLSPTTCLTIME